MAFVDAAGEVWSAQVQQVSTDAADRVEAVVARDPVRLAGSGRTGVARCTP